MRGERNGQNACYAYFPSIKYIRSLFCGVSNMLCVVWQALKLVQR